MLTEEDKKFLTAQYANWSLENGGAVKGVIIKDFELPKGYIPNKVDLMLLILPDYPTVAIDMFYLNPCVARADGTAINALDKETYFGRSWQRWSRHYQWQPGEDSLVSHVGLIKNVLLGELG